MICFRALRLLYVCVCVTVYYVHHGGSPFLAATSEGRRRGNKGFGFPANNLRFRSREACAIHCMIERKETMADTSRLDAERERDEALS
eukprot:scaffold64288_cov52-Attheya_sp.AAC.1